MYGVVEFLLHIIITPCVVEFILHIIITPCMYGVVEFILHIITPYVGRGVCSLVNRETLLDLRSELRSNALPAATTVAFLGPNP